MYEENAFELLPLFKNIKRENISGLIECLGANVHTYKKGAVIMWEGEKTDKIGVVLEGSVIVYRDTSDGNRTILSYVKAFDTFGQEYAGAGIGSMPANISANEDSRVMFIPFKKIMNPCGNHCDNHDNLLKNLVSIMAKTNLTLEEKIECMSGRTTKDKLMTYLRSQARRNGSDTFEIAYDRQTLADYLGVERSAMSSEIGKLRDEGKIIVSKRKFTLVRRSK